MCSGEDQRHDPYSEYEFQAELEVEEGRPTQCLRGRYSSTPLRPFLPPDCVSIQISPCKSNSLQFLPGMTLPIAKNEASGLPLFLGSIVSAFRLEGSATSLFCQGNGVYPLYLLCPALGCPATQMKI